MTQHRTIAGRWFITAALVLQLVPLVLFPPESFSTKTQEWWLPVLLAILVLWADVELLVRRSDQLWPWYLMSFSQGFNVISRIMMIWPHATMTVNKVDVLNGPYILITFVAIALSVFCLWYMEQPDVRLGLLRE